MTTLPSLIATVLLVVAHGLSAQTVYRCGNSYSQTPCPGGSAIDASDSRTPEQRKAHEASVRNEKRSADRLEQTREKEEAAVRRETERQEQARRDAEKASAKAATQKKSAGKEKIPAYRAPAQN